MSKMPRKNAMRDNVNAVRTRLPHLSNLSREQIELALLYYETNVDETVNAFNRNGAIEALSGWTEMNNARGNTSSKRRNNKPRNTNNTSLMITPPSSGILRPSQRVSNIFQTFAEGGIPTVPINGSTTTSSTFSPSFSDETNLHHSEKDFSDPITSTDDVFTEEPKSQRRKSIKSRNNSATQSHEPPTTIHNQPLPNSPIANNKKLLTKSVKDLQRQTSTLSNVELLFTNEIKSSLKRIDDIFKQLRDIIKEREVELYLEMDKVKEQGLNVIHRRQQRAVELRQRIDRCDRLEPNEIDHLRTDIKQFVTDRRYELGEELTSSHRFEYDQTLIESLKNFGHVLRIERRCSLAAPPSPSIETNLPTEQPTFNITPEKVVVNDKSQSNNQVMNTPINGNNTSDNPQKLHSLLKTNGYYDDTNNYQNVNRRRPPPLQYFQGPRPVLNYQNGNQRRNGSKQINGRVNNHNPSETTNTYRRPRPPASPQSIAPLKT